MIASTSPWNRRRAIVRTASELYGRLVARAREPWLYADVGVPDSPEGRLELLLMHMVLMLERLKATGPAGSPLARALTETFVTDMDDCLREMGVGDLTVPRKVKKAAAALYDRSRDYGEALRARDRARLAALLATHVWSGAPSDDAAASRGLRLAGYALDLAEALGGLADAAVLEGSISLSAAPPVSATARDVP